MKFITCPAGVYQANCYIVYDDSSNCGFIIDPGGEHDKILDLVNKHSIKIEFIILTHGHFDHTGGVNAIKGKLNIPLFMDESDSFLVSDSDGINNTLPITIDMALKDGDTIKFGNGSLKIISTPGHTPGGITVSVSSMLFTGDTLFKDSIGRTDFPGGSYKQLKDSIKSKLFIFPDNTHVYPGHGPSTTIGYEKKYNPFV